MADVEQENAQLKQALQDLLDAIPAARSACSPNRLKAVRRARKLLKELGGREAAARAVEPKTCSAAPLTVGAPPNPRRPRACPRST